MAMVPRFLLCVVSVLFSVFSLDAGESKIPSVLYLTCAQNPSDSMTVHWHSSEREKESELLFRKKGEEVWLAKSGNSLKLSTTSFIVHTVDLEGLDPDTDYEFQIKTNRKLYYFRTLPATMTRTVRFVVGGDAYVYDNVMQRMNTVVASCDPDFVVMGGDIAYTHGRRASFRGKKWEVRRWRAFLKRWREQMVTPEGRLIPIIPVLGNHDIQGIGLDPSKTLFLICLLCLKRDFRLGLWM